MNDKLMDTLALLKTQHENKYMITKYNRNQNKIIVTTNSDENMFSII